MLTFDGLSGKLATDFIQQSPPMDVTSGSGNPAADKYVLIAWADPNGDWPNQVTAQLLTANFTASATNTGTTSVNFAAASTAAGWTFAGTPAAITIEPAPARGSISGYVFVNADQNGQYAAGEGLPGVTVTLGGSKQATVQTDANGYYQFTGLTPGVYTVAQTPPAAIIAGPAEAGTIAGRTVGTATNPGDSIDAIALGTAQNGVNYNFTESSFLPGWIPNRLLATSTQPAGSAAWNQTISSTLTQAQQSIQTAAAPVAVAAALASNAAIGAGSQVLRPR